jgi:predicted MPP superfamily phosphohydrolase
MTSISKKLLRFVNKTNKGQSNTVPVSRRNPPALSPEFCPYPLSHKVSFAVQKKIQEARSGLCTRIGDTGFRPDVFDIVPLTVEIAELGPAFRGYRIVQISDIHMGQWITAERLMGVVDIVNRQNPDLIAITGDFVSYVFEPLAGDLASSLNKLRPRDAAVAILGNHDHWVDARGIRDLMRDCNVTDLSNDVFTIRKGRADLHIAGVDSVMENRDRLDLVMKKLPPDGPAILLAHEPDFADISSKTGRFDLQLSGHSHGGQLVIPGIGTPIRSWHFRKYPLGRYQVGSMVQYTNRGLGTNLFWSRINCPPEITVIELNEKEG